MVTIDYKMLVRIKFKVINSPEMTRLKNIIRNSLSAKKSRIMEL